jgi:hypothetical protein
MKSILSSLLILFATTAFSQQQNNQRNNNQSTTIIQRTTNTTKPPQYNVGVTNRGQTVVQPTQAPRRSGVEVYKVQRYTPKGRENKTIWIQEQGNGRTVVREWDR